MCLDSRSPPTPVPVLHLHFSNRHEVLAERLVGALAQSRAGVFGREQVIVPSAAWQRWLSLHVARRLGVCTQVEFSFLGPWLWQQLPADDPLRTPAPDTHRLAWRIWRLWADPARRAEHSRLRDALGAAGPGDDGALLRLGLARLAAERIEAVETWRPDWLAAWRAGRSALASMPGVTAQHQADEAWQSALWRELRLVSGKVGDEGGDEGLGADIGASDTATSPQAVHLFALPAVPPVHLAALRRLAQGREVHAYLFNPCREYWFDLVSPRRFAHLRLRGQSDAHEVGHALLARWGGSLQAQLSLWQQALGEEGALDDGDYASNVERFEAAGHESSTTLLHRVQDSLLDLAEPAAGDWPLESHDRSIELHVCHSLTRELEVLQQRLLAMFAADPTLRSGDVWVGVPDLDAAAASIDAVFGSAVGRESLPYTLTGRSQRQAAMRTHSLLAVLDLVASRCTASDLFGVLQLPLVAGALGLDDSELAEAMAALRDAGLRWGLDAWHVSRFDVPAHGHTLDQTLERLVLGLCLPPQPESLLAGAIAGRAAETAAVPTWPASAPPGRHGQWLVGVLSRWARQLVDLARTLAVPRPASAWCDWLVGTVLTQLAEPTDADAIAEQQQLRRDLVAMFAVAEAELGDTAMPWNVCREALAQALDSPARGGVAAGAVTFSSISPLRGLPFRVICLLGLDDGVFPSPQTPADFDLVAAWPRAGDRQRRIDDRGLFLECLLSARQTLHLSYTGRSVIDNSIRPPSLLLSELLDWLLPAIAQAPHDGAAMAAARQRLVVEHPLQAFDRCGFDRDADQRLRSSDTRLLRAWQQRVAHPTHPSPGGLGADLDGFEADGVSEDADAPSVDADLSPFVLASMPAADAVDDPLDFSELVSWFRHPARHWLRARLDLVLPGDDEVVDDEEPLEARDTRERRRLWRHWLGLLLATSEPQTPDAATAADWTQRARLGPAAGWGQVWLQQEWPALVAYADALRQALRASGRDPVLESRHGPRAGTGHELMLEWPGDADGGMPPVRLRWSAPATQVESASEQLLWYPGDRRGPDVIEAWLQHLATQAAGRPCATRLMHAPSDLPNPRQASNTLRWPALDAGRASQLLTPLVGLFLRGRNRPLPWLPRTAWAWIESGRKDSVAEKTWRDSDRSFGESSDAAWRLVLRGQPDPLGSGAFQPLADAVFGPAFDLAGLDEAPAEAEGDA